MKKILVLLTFLFMMGCTEQNQENVRNVTSESPIQTSSDLQVDHFNMWVKNPTKAKQLLLDIGFTAVPDSLSQIHHGQGTAGRYFSFLNAYLELIFVYDQKELEVNSTKNEALDFSERANFENNGASPFSIALKIKDYQIKKIPFETVAYRQDWMEENTSIFAAKSSKTHLKQPSVFVVYPEIEADVFESLSALDSMPTKDDFWKAFFKHPNGAKKVTQIVITSTDKSLTTKTILALNGIENVTVKTGKEHLMELHFDDDALGKSFDLRPDLPLVIYL